MTGAGGGGEAAKNFDQRVPEYDDAQPTAIAAKFRIRTFRSKLSAFKVSFGIGCDLACSQHESGALPNTAIRLVLRWLIFCPDIPIQQC